MNGQPIKPPAVLRGLGWTWTEAGPIVHLKIDGRQIAVLVPLARVHIEFAREFASVGAPLPAYVGAYGVGGLWGSIKKAAKKVGKSATRVVKRAAKGVSRVATKYGGKALKSAKNIVRDKRFRAGLAIASVAVPALAPVAAGVETANRALDYYERGRAVAKRVARGIQRPGDIPKMAAAVATEEAIGVIAQQAQRGYPDAQRWIGSMHAAQQTRNLARAASPMARGFLSRAMPARGFAGPAAFRAFQPRQPAAMRAPLGSLFGRTRARRPMPSRFVPPARFLPSHFARPSFTRPSFGRFV